MSKNVKDIVIKDSSENLVVEKYDYDAVVAKMTPEKKAEYLEMTKTIVPTDATTVRQFGHEVVQIVARNGDSMLNTTKANNSNEVVALTNALLAELNTVDIDELNMSPWKRFVRSLPLVNKLMISAENFALKYETVAHNVDEIYKKMDNARDIANRDNSELQTIIEDNKLFLTQARDCILALKVRKEEAEKQMKDMELNDPTNTYAIKECDDFINQLNKKIANMETTEYVINQNMFQIAAIKGNNEAIAEKAEHIKEEVLPIWKSQLALSITLNNQKASIEAEQKIADTTNEILKKNANSLKMNSITVAKATERAVIDMDTLKTTTNDLIETIKEVRKIHDEGDKNRLELEKGLKDLAIQLHNEVSSLNK